MADGLNRSKHVPAKTARINESSKDLWASKLGVTKICLFALDSHLVQSNQYIQTVFRLFVKQSIDTKSKTGLRPKSYLSKFFVFIYLYDPCRFKSSKIGRSDKNFHSNDMHHNKSMWKYEKNKQKASNKWHIISNKFLHCQN